MNRDPVSSIPDSLGKNKFAIGGTIIQSPNLVAKNPTFEGNRGCDQNNS
ncbi:hypothetical protein DDB_G0280325 [Dictyostelium discoideum AX4]|nr:hypothetical protein DDB_G0280325 [Dictyostelium discoideum AX4]EAL67389.1 hypothetical protein DDB_G0280325 [Dictyostelium discoideum AX4]|eukprot:XP_641376.1 hypothetical protein DDB_G0280325 [Dictyostelium discoideum AX4]